MDFERIKELSASDKFCLVRPRKKEGETAEEDVLETVFTYEGINNVYYQNDKGNVAVSMKVHRAKSEEGKILHFHGDVKIIKVGKKEETTRRG